MAFDTADGTPAVTVAGRWVPLVVSDGAGRGALPDASAPGGAVPRGVTTGDVGVRPAPGGMVVRRRRRA